MVLGADTYFLRQSGNKTVTKAGSMRDSNIFSSRNFEVQETNDSVIPEPQILGQIVPEDKPLSPRVSEIDKMYDLLLTRNQQDSHQFSHDYLKRKIDLRLKEIEELSAEK